MSRDESSSFTRLCQLLCLCSPNKEGLSSRTSGPHKATPEDDNKRNKRQPKHDENEAVVTTEPLLSPLTANTQRPYPHGPRKLFSLSRRSSKRFGEIDQSTVLCCSSKPPSVGQVDLCPRPWYGQNYPGEDESHQARQHSQTEQTDGTLDEHSCQVLICDILWRTLFFMTCLPLCYACYFSRTIRRRRKITQAEYILTRSNQQLHARNQSRTKSKLVAEGQDIMGQTMFHQMKQAKLSLKEKITTLPRQPEELTRPDDQGVVEPEESLGLPNDSNHSRPQEEDASPTKVIKLNVIVLHSTSSLLIHKPLISELGIAPSSPYLQGSQCDGLPKGHAVPAGTSLEMSGTRFLEVPGAKASSIRRLTVLPNAPYTRNGGHHGDNSGLDGLDGRLTETVVVPHHGDNSVRFLSQEKLSTVVEDEPPDETSVLIHAETIESSTRRSSSSVSEQFFECTDSIPSTPITSPEDELQLPSIVRSTSQIEEEVVTFRSNVQETKRDHRTNWKKVSAVFRWKAIGAHKGKTLEIGETVPDGSSDIGEPLLDPRVSTNSSERSASSEKIPASRLSLLPVKMGQDNSGSSDSVQLRAKEAKPRTKRKSNSGRRSSLFRSGLSFRKRRTSSKIGPHHVEDRVRMEALGNRTELIKDLGFQLSFAIFDEASVSRWKGRDLQEAIEIPNMDLFLLAVRQNNLSELNEVLNTKSGMISYLAKFWKGFYPLLLIEIISGNNNTNSEETETYSSQLKRIHAFFGDVHHIQIPEEDLKDHMDWITECMGRLYIHARLYQCSRFYGDGLSNLDRCPGGCELKKNRTRPSRKLARKPALLKKHSRSAYGRTKIISESS